MAVPSLFWKLIEQATGTAKARLGELALTKTRSCSDAPNTVTMTTPSFITYTRRGSPPHLTSDQHDGLLTPFFAVSLDHMIVPYVEASHAETHPDGLTAFCNIKDQFVLLQPQDTADYMPSTRNRDWTVTLRTNVGNKTASVNWFIDRVRGLRPDAYVAIADNLNEPNVSQKRMERSLTRSVKMLETCLSNSGLADIPVFAAVQGGTSTEMRKLSAKEMSEKNVSGFVVNVQGLAETLQDRTRLLESSASELPLDKPLIVYGMGQPDEVATAISLGADLFDGSFPYQMTERNVAMQIEFPKFTYCPISEPSQAFLCLSNPEFRQDHRPIQLGCECFACKNHTRAYIYHLLFAKEMLGPILIMHHNLHQYQTFFKSLRESLRSKTFEADKETFLKGFDFSLPIPAQDLLADAPELGQKEVHGELPPVARFRNEENTSCTMGANDGHASVEGKRSSVD